MSSATAPRHLTGSCLCGAVRYEVADAFEYAANCHCSKCRRTTGAACKPFAGIPVGQGLVALEADVAVHEQQIHCASGGGDRGAAGLEMTGKVQ